MWRERRPGCVQLVVGALFAVGVLVSLVYSATVGRGRPTMNIYTDDRITYNNFEVGTGGFLSDYFNVAEGRYVGTAPVGVGHVLSLYNRSVGNTLVNTQMTFADLPTEGAVSTGLVCRGSRQGTGYYFLVASTGRASIRIGTADTLDLKPLLDWRTVPQIDTTLENNEIQAACIENYLAMYVNGVLVGEVNDDTYQRGRVGLALATSSAEAQVGYDRVSVWQATARR